MCTRLENSINLSRSEGMSGAAEVVSPPKAVSEVSAPAESVQPLEKAQVTIITHPLENMESGPLCLTRIRSHPPRSEVLN